jgi:acyl-coenzyme A thioesterase PaaI-like protein
VHHPWRRWLAVSRTPGEGLLEATGDLHAVMMDILRARLGERLAEFAFPPPVFQAMEGEFVEFDRDAGSLTVRFPILKSYLNPYGTVQGGMLAAAVDSTLGPLSVLVAPISVTRHLELTYSRPATPDMEHIVVRARFVERQDRRLTFRAEVFSPSGDRLVRARAVHWIVES